MPVGSPDYITATQGLHAGPDDCLIDCWSQVNGNTPHLPTCGVFDHEQWQEGAHCRDFFFASKDMASRVTDITVDVDTAASDHQPLNLTLL